MLPTVELAIGLVGPGLIGSTFLKQIHAQAPILRESYGLQLQVLGVTNSKTMLLSSQPLDLSTWNKQFQEQAEPADLARFGAHLLSCTTKYKVIVDCTASDVPPQQYNSWAQAGLHIITPNKQFGAGPLQRYKALKDLRAKNGVHFFYEGTVGAGLPIISSLRSLLDTGDQVVRMEGILSGTLSYIFNTFKEGDKFSEVVASAKAAGYTEPDPREDLAGQDVARKVVILARECGLDVEMHDLQVESLVPPALQAVPSADDFMQRLPEYDDSMGQQLLDASSRGEVIRYVGTVDVLNRTAAVALRRYPKDHPFAQLAGSDNMVVFTTARYSTNPLIIRGPGAGAEVTAAGVFGDLVHLGRCLGAGS